MFIDTHCHLDWTAFDPDRDEVIRRAIGAGVTRMVSIGVDVASSRRSIQLADQHPAVYAAVGVHPNDCASFDAATLNEIRSLAQHPKVVAIGEIGLDDYWHKVDPDQQARAFQAQLGLAAELNKPVIIHSRAAVSDVMTLLESFTHDAARITGVLHSYFDSLEVAQRAFELGFFIGVSGPITFKKAGRERAVVKQLPLDRILIETDAPFLTPMPHRGQRNEPAYIRHVAETITQITALPLEQVARQTTANAARLFGRAMEFVG